MGEFEQLVLLALLRLGNDAYGMQVREEIETRTGREVSYGAVYTTLDRLEQKGYVAHRLGEATAERGGRAKKYFRALPAGREALRTRQQALAVMRQGVRLSPDARAVTRERQPCRNSARPGSGSTATRSSSAIGVQKWPSARTASSAASAASARCAAGDVM
jgi:DNA-binding PadR family transcriptional regulator